MRPTVLLIAEGTRLPEDLRRRLERAEELGRVVVVRSSEVRDLPPLERLDAPVLVASDRGPDQPPLEPSPDLVAMVRAAATERLTIDLGSSGAASNYPDLARLIARTDDRPDPGASQRAFLDERRRRARRRRR